MKKIPALALCMFCAVLCYGQFSPGRAALGKMEKGKWKDAEKLIRRSLRKDSVNAEINYLFSWFYNMRENPDADPDSAYRYVRRALRDFSNSSEKDREQMRRFPVDSQILVRQRRNIDSAAFERAKKINTETGYRLFIRQFSESGKISEAQELGDEVAFLDALKINTSSAFQRYIADHPFSLRKAEAVRRYEKMLYVDKTSDGKLSSYRKFYSEFPASTWRDEAERSIFEISTASGNPNSFVRFVEEFPNGRLRHRALGVVYHLMKEEERESGLLSDSLREIQHKENGYWVPVVKNGKFGFMNQAGLETIAPVFDSIPEAYRCGNIRSDYLTVAGGIINRSGHWIVTGRLTDVQDIGGGFLKITRDSCRTCVHKSGWAVPEACHDDYKMIGLRFIAFREHTKWGLLSLSGKRLLDAQFEDILALDTLIIFSGNGKRTLATPDQVAGIADRNAFVPTLVFDDVRRLSGGNYLVRNGTLEGVLNEKLVFIIPFDRHTIEIAPRGFVLASNQKYRVTDLPGIPSTREFDQVNFYGKWVKLRSGKEIRLYNLDLRRLEPILPDSLWFLNQLAFARRNDSIRVYLNPTASVRYPDDERVSFIKSVDSSRYFFIADKKRKTIYSTVTGRRMFSVAAEAIEYIGHDSFLITRSSKKGIVSMEGKTLLPVEYAAIVPLPGDWISLLKEKKFGIYNGRTHSLIKPAYDQNLQPFSARRLIAFRNGLFGFIGLDAKPQGDFEFDEVRLWNDTAAMVRKNFQWMIITTGAHAIALRNIKEYHVESESTGETIAVIRKDNYYGVVSNRRGELIPASFTGIVNIGSSDEPLFFTDKYVEEAGIHVVIYYDRDGKVLRKQAIEDTEFDHLSCDD